LTAHLGRLIAVVALALASADPPSSLLAPAAAWEKVAGGGRVSVFREATDGANGLAFDKDRRPGGLRGQRSRSGTAPGADREGRQGDRARGALSGQAPEQPEDPTNCTFGGPGRNVLYVTTNASLYRIRTAVRGQESPPGK
jgi:hypothetical protein